MKRVSFTTEFLFKASNTIVYRFLTAPDCLIRWFCDKADIEDNAYIYSWDGEEEVAKIIEDIEDEFLKLQSDEADNDQEFLEFRLSKSPVTNETILLITDWADADEIEDQKALWTKQMAVLKTAMGG